MVEEPCVSLGHMALGHCGHREGLLAAERTAQTNLVADSDQPMRLAALAIHFYLAALAGALRLGAGAIETGHVEPHIDPDCRCALIHSKQFIYSLHNATLSAVRHDSRFEVLTNANEFDPAMLEAIAEAQRTINMECYIFRPDKTGRAFMLALMGDADGAVSAFQVVPPLEIEQSHPP